MENQKLRETLDEYHVEFKEVKNQGLSYYLLFVCAQHICLFSRS